MMPPAPQQQQGNHLDRGRQQGVGGGQGQQPLARRAAGADFSVLDRHAFGIDYAHTLAHWHRDFEAAWPQISAQGFDERFRRLWRFYLAYCEAGFRSGATDVYHFLLEKPRA